MEDFSFYKGKRVLITGHTGFKGSWMCKVLLLLGAEVTGYALEAHTQPSLFNILGLESQVNSVVGDICDLKHLQETFCLVKPEIVIHMAAQPLVRESYKKPVETYAVNVMGTVNILECVRNTDSVRSFVNVTTDKVYFNKEWEWGYRENEELNGYDPYSNSKSCSELITSSYRNSFFSKRQVAISTVRAGNVIGGGDFAEDRIIPDCVRAVMLGREIIVRNPYSIRPYQHVLESVMAYLMIAMKQYMDNSYAGNYNVGPNESDCWTTGELVTLFCSMWRTVSGKEVTWISGYDGGPHEAHYLKLDCSKIKNTFGWRPVWDIKKAMHELVTWNYLYQTEGNISEFMNNQIAAFLSK